MFNRLNSPRTAPTPAPIDQIRLSSGPDKAIFTFDDKPAGLTAADVLKSYTGNQSQKAVTAKSTSTPVLLPPQVNEFREEEDIKKPNHVRIEQTKPLASTGKPIETQTTVDAKDSMGEKGLEREYMSKASEYLNSLPAGKEAVTADLIKNVVLKLSNPYTPSPKLKPDTVESLKTQYLETIAAYCNGLGKIGVNAVTKDFLEQTLEMNQGNFLRLCAALVGKKILAIDSLDEVVGLCKALDGVLPKEVKPEVATSKAGTEAKPASKDPMDSMSSWPNQEKRDNRKSLVLPLQCNSLLT
jgi:hypothetical protein